MKSSYLIIPLLILALVGSVSAELYHSGNNILREEDSIYIQHSQSDYFDDDPALFSVLKATINLGCESISTWNSVNSNNTIINATLKYTYLSCIVQGGGIETNCSIVEDYVGCGGGKDTCDETNTPAIIEQSFGIQEGEYLSVDLVTLFNSTNDTIDDSACRYDIQYQSINCQNCGDLAFDEVVQEIDTRAQTFQDVTVSVYTFMNSAVNMNFQIWAILSLLVKIGVLVGAVFFLFYCVFWLYFKIRQFFMIERGGNR